MVCVWSAHSPRPRSANRLSPANSATICFSSPPVDCTDPIPHTTDMCLIRGQSGTIPELEGLDKDSGTISQQVSLMLPSDESGTRVHRRGTVRCSLANRSATLLLQPSCRLRSIANLPLTSRSTPRSSFTCTGLRAPTANSDGGIRCLGKLIPPIRELWAETM